VLFYAVLIVVLLGMIRPWWVLWFMDRQHRWGVIKIWGSILITLGCILVVLHWL
jgi:hypothetical protein